MTGHESRIGRAALLVGYLALTFAVVTAHRTPALGPELSIYASTPREFWIGVGVAIPIGLVASFRWSHTHRIPQAGYLLSGTAVFAVAGLPIIRGYDYYGTGDALTHLGWVKMFDAGALHPASIRYPGIHSISVFLSNATGTGAEQAVMLMLVSFVLVYLLFVPLCVRAITDSAPAMTVGVGSALLLLPINNVGVHLTPYPTTQAIMFAPVVLFLLLCCARGSGGWTSWKPASAAGMFLSLSMIGLVLLHPQQALNVLLGLVTISAAQFLYRWTAEGGPTPGHRPLYDQTAVFSLVFLLWAIPQERIRSAAAYVLSGLLSNPSAGSEVSGRSASITTLGGSLAELFLKLFGVSTVFVLLAGAVTLTVIVGGRRNGSEEDTLLRYLIVAGVPVAGLLLVFMVTDTSTQHFRYLGFGILLVTILGAVAVTRAVDRLDAASNSTAVAIGLGVVFSLFVVLQLSVFHASPHIYQQTPHISDAEMSGYETAFDSRDETIAFAGIGNHPRRYADAYYGTDSKMSRELPGRRHAVPQDAFREDIVANYDDQRYVPVTTSDTRREIELYQGVRYSEDGFQRLEEDADIDRVQANDHFELYLLDSDGAGSGETNDNSGS